MGTPEPAPRNETKDGKPWNGVFREEIDDDDGTGHALIHYRDGKIHRDDDEPAYTRFDEDGRMTEQGWYKGGVRRRENGPGTVLYGDTGEKEVEEWYDEQGQLHSTDDRPALIIYRNGTIAAQSWYHGGQLHRGEDKPAELFWEDDGTLLGVRFYTHGKPDRAVGPAHYQCVPEDGLETEHWMRDGKYDRRDGPACLSVESYQDDDGNWQREIVGGFWSRNGVEHEPSAHDRLRWEATQTRQGGFLWRKTEAQPEARATTQNER